MLLHTPLYLLFLLGSVAVYWLLPRPVWRTLWLVVASYGFYGLFDWRFAALLLGLTVVVYRIGQAIPNSAHARALAWTSVGLNLGLLGLFKYNGFFLANLHTLGLPISDGLQLLLPLGISFYTFQAIAYTTEIYRKKLEPVANFVEFALYLAFFPKLIAGPLMRPAAFFQQIAKPTPRLTAPAIRDALGLLVLGLFKKIVIADGLASLAEVAFSAAAYPTSAPFPTPLYWQGFYLYAFQIYADFSGYTDLARASAMLLGFSLPDNFQQPYLAPTVGVFWNRWHMSLTQWFREYLFFPLSRILLNATQRRYPRLVQVAVNLITMTLIGLWHGAAWTFVAWGLWHGLLLSIERLADFKPTKTWQKVLGWLITFHLVGIGWVLFRADSFASASRFLIGLVNAQQLAWFALYLPVALVCASVVFGLDIWWSGPLPDRLRRWPHWQPIGLTASVMMVLVLWVLAAVRGVDARPFIYGRF